MPVWPPTLNKVHLPLPLSSSGWKSLYFSLMISLNSLFALWCVPCTQGLTTGTATTPLPVMEDTAFNGVGMVSPHQAMAAPTESKHHPPAVFESPSQNSNLFVACMHMDNATIPWSRSISWSKMTTRWLFTTAALCPCRMFQTHQLSAFYSRLPWPQACLRRQPSSEMSGFLSYTQVSLLN